MASDLKTQLNKLLELQKIDTEIYSLRAEKAAQPAEVLNIQAQFDAKKQGMADLEKKFLDIQKQRKDKEGELASKEAEGKKLQSQLFSLKTNKEYQTMLQQIQDSKADASVIEDKIIELLDSQDKVKTEVEKEKQHLGEEEKGFVSGKKKIEDRGKEIDDRLAQLEAQRKQQLPDIDLKILSQYDRILNSRDGLAIVGIKDNSCEGCNMFVPPQVINLIQMYERIVTCEICNRILHV